MNIAQPAGSQASYSLLPLVIVGSLVLGIMLLVALAILIGRRTVVTTPRELGALALTLASILLLSGLWCIFLSPTTTYSETKESLYRPISIDGLRGWNYSFNIQEGDVLAGSVNERILPDSTNASKTFNIQIYDPDGSVVWSETNVTKSYFNVKASRAGVLRVELKNPNRWVVECYVQITISAKVTHRPLEPVGQWLSLVSLPVFGLGTWASGVLTIIRRPAKSTVNPRVEALIDTIMKEEASKR